MFFEDWRMIVLVGSAVLLIFIIAITFLISDRNDRSYKRGILKYSNSKRIIAIDFKNKTVRYFNLTNLRNVTETSLSDFYNQFPSNGGADFKTWTNNLINRVEGTPTVLETKVSIHKKTDTLLSTVVVDKIDYENQIIHLTSYVVKGEKFDQDYLQKRRIVYPTNYVLNVLEKSMKSNGFTLAFTFKYTSTIEETKDIDSLYFTKFKNFFFEFLNNSRYLVEESSNTLIFTDVHSKNAKFTAETIAKSIYSSITTYLSLNGLGDTITVFAGGVEHAVLKKEPSRIIKEALYMSQVAQAEGRDHKIEWFKGVHNIPLSGFENSYRTEVERIIYDKKLTNKFRLIYNARMDYTYGYVVKTFVNDPFFQSSEELEDYAYRSGDLRELITTVIADIVPKFNNQRPSSSTILFFPARTDEKGFLLSSFMSVPNTKGVQLSFVLTEDDLLNKLKSVREVDLIEDLRTIKSKGFEISLVVSEEGLRLSNAMYTIFNSFFVNFAVGKSGVGIDNDLRNPLHMLVEKLIKYQKPIICNDLEGWDAIELLVRSGLTYFCSESLSPYSEMLLRLDPKVIKKIAAMKG